MVLLVSYPVPVEGIHHTQPNVAVNIEDCNVETGTLYITESCVLWLNPRDEGIQLEYKQISLHAISRDLSAFPHEHLLCHYEGKLPGMNKSDNESDDEENDADSECELTEIRFVPENKGSLEAMFEALADCQTLHPDSDCQLSEDEFGNAEDGGGDGIYNTTEGISQLTEQGNANLERLNHILMTGQGDEDIALRTTQLSLVNGKFWKSIVKKGERVEEGEGVKIFHYGHSGAEQQAEDDQFQDADDMDE